jgi:hypothetical protein
MWVPQFHRFLIRNFEDDSQVSIWNIGMAKCGCVMDTAEKYREYAEECRRMAQKATATDKAALLEIAQAWDQCAAEATRVEGRKKEAKAADT